MRIYNPNDPAQAEIEVTEKAFEICYRPAGFAPVTALKSAKAIADTAKRLSEVLKDPQPAETVIDLDAEPVDAPKPASKPATRGRKPKNK